MSLPVRCFTCNKVIGHLENEYVRVMGDENKVEDFFNNKGIRRFCCKRMFMTTCYEIHDRFIVCNEENLPDSVKIGETKQVRYLKAI